MITNLKQKLAGISMKTAPKPPVSTENIDINCSIYENIYHRDYLIGNVDVDSFLDVNASMLNKLCFCEDEDLTIEDIVFFDTETTGLSGGTGTIAFLVGVAYVENNSIICKQFLMNDYQQEQDMLEKFCEVLNSHKAVASYNGRSFDAPLVNSRLILNRLDRPLPEMVHMDLLHATRRLYKNRLDKCSLSRIEEQVLGINRIDDIPGAEIPEIFFEFLKTGDRTKLDKVIEHNKQDIISLCALAYKLSNAFEFPLSLEYKEDVFSQGVIFERLGYQEYAKMCYNNQDNAESIQRLAFLYKRENDHVKAIELFKSVSNKQFFDYSADIEIAKISEHKLHDLSLAIKHTNIAIEKTARNQLISDNIGLEELRRRKSRLNKKQNIITEKKDGKQTCH